MYVHTHLNPLKNKSDITRHTLHQEFKMIKKQLLYSSLLAELCCRILKNKYKFVYATAFHGCNLSLCSVVLWKLKYFKLDTLHKASREKASFSISLQCAFEPAIFMFFMNKNSISFFKFKFSFTLRRIGYHNSVSAE